MWNHTSAPARAANTRTRSSPPPQPRVLTQARARLRLLFPPRLRRTGHHRKSLVIKGEVSGSELSTWTARSKAPFTSRAIVVTVGRNASSPQYHAREIVVLARFAATSPPAIASTFAARARHRRRHAQRTSPSKTAPSSRVGIDIRKPGSNERWRVEGCCECQRRDPFRYGLVFAFLPEAPGRLQDAHRVRNLSAGAF